MLWLQLAFCAMQGCTLGLFAHIYNQKLLKWFSLHFPSVRTHKQPHITLLFFPFASNRVMSLCMQIHVNVSQRPHLEKLTRNSTQLCIQQVIRDILMLICFLDLTLKKATDGFVCPIVQHYLSNELGRSLQC